MRFIKALISAALAGTLLLTGCAENENNSQSGTDNSISENSSPEDNNMNTELSFIPDENNVKLIGRTTEYDNIRWISLSASGIEFTFSGTKCDITVVGDNMISNPEKQARFAVYINGEKTLDEMVTNPEQVYSVYSSEAAAETTVKLLKLSEAAESTMGISKITTDGEIKPTAEKALKLEFIGDSITCGYGVDDEDKDHHFKTSTEDATRAYAYKTAMALDADYSLFSFSGNGIISGYSENGQKVTSQRVPDVYEKIGKSWGNYNDFNIQDVDWDFGKFVPDFVIINLGTNDASYTKGDKEKVMDYIDSYAEFLKVVREKNPDAHIICSLGVMGADLMVGVKKAAEKYTEETGDSNISTFRFTQQNGDVNGLAADWHPTAKTHDIAAAELTEYLKSLINA